MGIPIRKTARILILEEIKRRLSQIKKLNGYDFDIKTVQLTDAGYILGDQFNLPGAYIWLTSDQTNSESKKSVDIRTGIVTIYLFDNASNEVEPIYISEMLSYNAWVALNRSNDFPRMDDEKSPYLGEFVNHIILQSNLILASELNKPWYGAELTIEIEYMAVKDFPFVLIKKNGKRIT